MKNTLSLAGLCVAFAAASHGEVLFEEDFMNYSDFAPCVTRDDGLKIGVDGVWTPHGELHCKATRPLDALSKPIAAPKTAGSISRCASTSRVRTRRSTAIQRR